MEFKRKTIRLKDGREAVIRSAQPSDAAEMAAFMKTTAGETEFLLRYPEECTMTEAAESVFLDDVLHSPDQVMPCCFMEGVLAGNAMLTMNSRIKTRHRASVAIGLRQEYWGLKQLELEYIEGNDRARRLYEKMGFVEVARVPDVYRLKDGSFRESILMMKKL